MKEEVAKEISQAADESQRYAKEVFNASKKATEDVAESRKLADEKEVDLSGEYRVKKLGAWSILKGKGRPKAA